MFFAAKEHLTFHHNISSIILEGNFHEKITWHIITLLHVYIKQYEAKMC